MPATAFFHKYRAVGVWIARILTGATLVFSGFAKAVDPWGFVYKMEEYLMAWGIDWAPREVMFVFAALLALFEFTTGLMLALGSFRRSAAFCAAVFMTAMLALSAYIWIADPVDDCGCFGDALVISNSATFAKNIVLCLLLFYLIPNSYKVAGLVNPLYQWLPIVASCLYCLTLSGIGYMVQPIVDFRPYKTGSSILPDSRNLDPLVFTYEKDGVVRDFDIDNLPDSSWTYVSNDQSIEVDERQLAVYDEDYTDITDEVISLSGLQVILAVSNPQYHNRARANLSNRINQYVKQFGGDMIALLPYSGEELEHWRSLANPTYPTYTAEETAIKELARGDAAFVFLVDGKIQWKKNSYTLPSDFPEAYALDGDTTNNNALTRISPVDDGSLCKKLTLALIAAIILAIILGLPLSLKKRKQARALGHQ